MKKAHTTENGKESDLGLVFTDARSVADRFTWFLHLLLCHRSGEPFPLSSGSQHRMWVHWGLPINTTYCNWQVTPDEVFADSRRTGEHTLACLNDSFYRHVRVHTSLLYLWLSVIRMPPAMAGGSTLRAAGVRALRFALPLTLDTGECRMASLRTA